MIYSSALKSSHNNPEIILCGPGFRLTAFFFPGKRTIAFVPAGTVTSRMNVSPFFSHATGMLPFGEGTTPLAHSRSQGKGAISNSPNPAAVGFTPSISV